MCAQWKQNNSRMRLWHMCDCRKCALCADCKTFSDPIWTDHRRNYRNCAGHESLLGNFRFPDRIFGIAMLLLGLLLLGKQFAITTVISTFAYPLSLRVLERLLGDMVLTQDVFLNVLFSGLGIGLSLSIIIRAGASSGGMDIPPLILERYLKIPVSVSLYVFDFCILLVQIPYNSMDMALYGIALVLIYTVVLDRLILSGTSKTEVKVVSLKADEIRERILSELDRGVTIIHAQGGYLKNDTELVFSVISNRELPRLEKLIRETDPESFVVVSRVSEVSGRGFSMDKAYR